MLLEPIMRMNKDIRESVLKLSPAEVRYLVDTYYQMQDARIRAANQERALTTAEEPHTVISWLLEQNENLENQIKKTLDVYSASDKLGQWARSNAGVGPVITAGLLAHFSFVKANGDRQLYAGAFWRFAGLDPTTKWEKGKKRPYNAFLKTLCCFKLGESFVKVSNKPDAFYGNLYKLRKEQEQAWNEEGKNAARSKEILTEKKLGKDTGAYQAYSGGKFPPAHVHRRAVRWVAKMFVAHYHYVGFRLLFNEEPPQPYVFSVLGHGNIIKPPHLEVVELK